MRTALCDTFGIEYPIFAFTHCRDVVAAVSKAGGLGVLGAVGFSPEQLEIELDWIDDHVDGKPYGVDTVMPQKKVDVHGESTDEMLAQIRSMIDANHWRYVDELMDRFELPPLPEGEEPHGVLGWTDDVAHRHVEIALARPIKLIANALGSPPKDVIDQAHAHGVLVAEVATMVLVPEVVEAVAPTPVLAAGGIGSGRQIAAALALGAQGAWLGSLWLTTAESGSSPAVLEAYLGATSSDTVRSRCYTGKPARMLRNQWTEAWADPNGPGPLGMPLQNILTSEANARIARSGRKDLQFAPVGQIVGRMNEVRPVRDVIYQLVEEYVEAVEELERGLRAPA